VTSYASDDNPNIFSPFNSIIAGATQFSSCLPPLVQGTTDYQRLGDSVQPIANKVALDVRIKGGTTSSANPYDLTVVVYYGVCKKFKKFDDLSAASASLCGELLRSGGVSAISGVEVQEFGGIVGDSHLPINTSTWTLKKKTFRLWKAPGILNGGAGSGNFTSPNKNLHSCVLDFSSFLPSKLKYVDSVDDEPDNYAPVWAMGYYYNDGTPPDTGSGSGVLEFKTNAMLLYKDI